jgi:hypothetical protein
LSAGGWTAVLLGAFVATAATGCESDDPAATGGLVGPGSHGAACSPSPDEKLVELSFPACVQLPTDYTPLDQMSVNDSYPPCVSDAGQYVISRAEGADGVSTIGRVGAFEEIRALLGFPGEKLPTPEDFVAARVIYSREQGIESRVNRREDEHYPPLEKACQDLSAEEQLTHAGRCVGPARIRPILLEAFQRGAKGEGDATVHAARIEAALIWFIYISTYKEATSATTAKHDVDSTWAMYTGGEQRDGKPVGLARYVRARSEQVHNRVFDGILAVRCWRDIDDGDVAVDLELRDRARAQMDAALLKGLALVVRSRVKALECAASFETLKILGQVLDREATLRDPASAAVLRTEIGKSSPAEIDVGAVVTALDSIFPCP